MRAHGAVEAGLPKVAPNARFTTTSEHAALRAPNPSMGAQRLRPLKHLKEEARQRRQFQAGNSSQAQSPSRSQSAFASPTTPMGGAGQQVVPRSESEPLRDLPPRSNKYVPRNDIPAAQVAPPGASPMFVDPNTLSELAKQTLSLAQQLPSVGVRTLRDAMTTVDSVLGIRSDLVEKLTQISDLATQAAVVMIDLRKRTAKQETELLTVRQEAASAADIAFVADERIGELHDELTENRHEREQLQEMFDRRVIELKQDLSNNHKLKGMTMATRKIELFRAQDIERLETEVRSLRATLHGLESTKVETKVLQERVQRLVTESNTSLATMHDLELKNGRLVHDLRSLMAKVATDNETGEVERRTLQRRITELQLDLSEAQTGDGAGGGGGAPSVAPSGSLVAKPMYSGNSRSRRVSDISAGALVVYKGGRVGTLNLQAVDALAKSNGLVFLQRMFNGWRLKQTSQQLEQQRAAAFAAQRDGLASRDRQARQLMDGKKELAQENAELHERLHELTTQAAAMAKTNESLQKTIESQNLKLTAALRDNSGFGGVPMDEIQVKALSAYNLLLAVLKGVKNRMKLDALKVESLSITNKNLDENVVVTVMNWMNEAFAFLSQLFVIEDRIIRVKTRITFLCIRLQQRIAKTTRNLRRETAVPKRAVIRQQLDGYEDILRATRALRSHIEATKRSLFVTANPSKQNELLAVTQAFEADVDGFDRRLKRNESVQFRFSLALTKLSTNMKFDAAHELVDEAAAVAIKHREDTIFKRNDPTGMKGRSSSAGSRPGSRNGGKRSNSPSGGHDDPDTEAALDAARKRELPPVRPPKEETSTALVATGSNKRAPGGVDPMEHRKSPAMLVGAILSTAPNGKLDHRSMKRLLEEEQKAQNLRTRMAVAPELKVQRDSMRERQRQHDAEVKERLRSLQPRGGVQHFVAFSGTVIPFRSNAHRPDVSGPMSPENENAAVVAKLLHEEMA